VPFGRILTCLSLALGLITLPAQKAASQGNADGQGKIKLDVPYEPSSEDVVEVMLQIAQVGKKDFVYDLGCGDGRIVIRAEQKEGARRVGVDLDPEGTIGKIAAGSQEPRKWKATRDPSSAKPLDL